MTGGLRENASLMAMAALLCVAETMISVPKVARAADLGGDCCADLEERVVELEATTVRKGNKKVAVQLYGKVNYATMWWDDGGEQNLYTVNNNNESTRTGIKGKAKISGDWDGGFRIEWEYRQALSSKLNQFNDDNQLENAIAIRWSQMYIANKYYGTLNWGQTATPKYDITKNAMEYISTVPGEGGGLSDTLVSDFRMNPSFFLRPKGFNNAEGLSTLSWVNIARCYSAGDQFNCSTRRNGVEYSSPDWAGFNVQWGYFEDDIWGAALRYKNTFNDTWMLSANAAYEKFTDERLQNGGGGGAGFRRDFDEWAGSAAFKHKPTGLFLMGAWSVSDSNDSNVKGAFNGEGPPQMTAWDLQGGIQRRMPWLGLAQYGETSFWGGYSDVNDGFAPGSNPNGNQICQPTCQAGSLGVKANMVIPKGNIPGIDIDTQITGSDVNEWFLAVDQSFESAAFHLYAAYQHFEANVSLIDSNRDRVPLSLDDFDVIYTGGRLYF
jgi:hypothetical protein